MRPMCAQVALLTLNRSGNGNHSRLDICFFRWRHPLKLYRTVVVGVAGSSVSPFHVFSVSRSLSKVIVPGFQDKGHCPGISRFILTYI